MKIYDWVFKAYIPHAASALEDSASLSPLDIPSRSMWRLLAISAIATVFIGYSSMFALKLAAKSQLKKMTLYPTIGKDTVSTSRNVVYNLLPDLRDKVETADDKVRGMIYEAFKKDISFGAFLKFLGHAGIANADENRVAEMIVGNIGFFNYNDATATEIADALQLNVDFGSRLSEPNPQKWNRDIAISLILKFRAELKKDISKPLRLLISLDGYIQWVTFLAFLFCLLILWLRLKWAKMQLGLINYPGKDGEAVPGIEWNRQYKNNLFYINSNQNSLAWIRDNYYNLFVAQRYIDDVTTSLQRDVVTEKSLFDTSQEIIKSSKESVEEGEYFIINYLLWLIPSLGFIGTIIGIISAMQGASGIFGAREALNQIMALDRVAAYLGTAFDTTFVSLILISILMLLNAFVQKREDTIFVKLESVSKRYFIYELLAKYYMKKTRGQ